MKILVLTLSAMLTVLVSGTAQAFCGFYVAKADTGLFNRASQVVLVRDGDRTVLTMANDFEGDVEDFAMVIPVPTFIERGQINVTDKALIDHLDAYTAPRLVEYFDPDPCFRYEAMPLTSDGRVAAEDSAAFRQRAKAKGVTIEASYTVGEYDILVLSARESNGLIDWLNDNGYRIPKGAEKVVGSYLKQDMRFFVAKVNLEAQAKSGYTYLRPIQVAYESPKFMLPIRLGTLNAKGAQELYVYALTKTGRVETTNYRTVKLPSNTDVPQFVKTDFAEFYRAMFANQVKQQNRKAVFLEYAWDMAWCDPCAADPLSAKQLRQLGVWWLDAGVDSRIAPGGPQNVFVTRLHVRYDQKTFPEDLVFHETGDRQNFQGRYVVHNPFEGAASCDLGPYQAQLRERREREAQQLANLTGWDIDDIRARIPLLANSKPVDDKPWWATLWD
ncbi:MAG: DUF2330 domain-containing protein [Woeseiaceae bacterium]|nr:DUF2330 domain-containing protein [Woeseiaceae bacterium]